MTTLAPWTEQWQHFTSDVREQFCGRRIGVGSCNPTFCNAWQRQRVGLVVGSATVLTVKPGADPTW